MTGEGAGGFAVAGADPAEAERRIQQWAQGFAEKAQRYQEVRERTEQLRLSASSPDGRIKVTVRADGSVTGLEFTDKVRSMAPNELAAQVLTTMHRAQADIASKVEETMVATIGDEDQQTRAVVLDNLRERFPEEVDEPEPEVDSRWDGPADEDVAIPPPATPPAAPPVPPAAPPKHPRRPRFEDDDDDDFGPDFDPLRD